MPTVWWAERHGPSLRNLPDRRFRFNIVDYLARAGFSAKPRGGSASGGKPPLTIPCGAMKSLLVFSLSIFQLSFLTGCATTFTYTPVSQSPGRMEFSNVSARRESGTVVVTGDMANELGFSVKDVVMQGAAFDALNTPVSRTSADLLGELPHEQARSFELVFPDTNRTVTSFQLVASTYAPRANVEHAGPKTFSKTIGFGAGATRSAGAMADAAGGLASPRRPRGAAGPSAQPALKQAAAWPPVSSPPYPVSSPAGSDPQLIQIESPIYSVNDEGRT